jgi:chemotaxis methyl-accepting protein methylase
MNRKSDKGELRIWSAGCSTGQEAYSIAMLIENLNSREQKKVRYRIIATDVSESALIKAKTGEYNEKEIQKIRVKDLNEFFVRFGETYKVSPQLKQHVSFSTYDLLDNLSSSPQESIFGNFDLIICSNVLFYYKLKYQQFIIKKLVGVMDEKGYLITGEAEKYNVEKSRYLNLVSTSSTIFQSKKEMHYET